MIKNFAELQERVRSSEPLVVSVAQAADQEVLLSVKAAADQGFIKPVLTGDRERIEELCGRIGLKPLEILQAGTEEEAVERAVRAVHDGSAQVLMKGNPQQGMGASYRTAAVHDGCLRGAGLSQAAVLF